jgi:3-oxoacyl-[acyl-carrier protein] reductase
MNSKKIMLVTGSSRGIGNAVARLGIEYNFEVILHGKSESIELIKLSKELGCKYISCDITNEKQVLSCLNKFDKIDVLINCAGINISKPFEDLTTEDWTNTFNTNVLGTVNFSKSIIPKMKKYKYGKIVNVASIKGYQSTVGRVAYASSKAAVINLTAGMAKELAPEILVNAISPGFTQTDMTNKTWSERIEKQVDSILLKRMAKPEEIAETILFLASDKSSYITGQTIIVDGGFYIKND